MRFADELQPPGRARSVAASLIGAWIRTAWPGSTGGPTLLARYIPMLQLLPVGVGDGQYLYVDLRDGLSHRLLSGAPWQEPPWEHDEQQVMRRVVRPGDRVFDIGAHMGLLTVLLASLVGRTGAVHAFEINPRKIPALRETVRRLPHATLHTFGLADREMQTDLFVPEDQTMASLADWTAGRVGPVERMTSSVRTIDALRAGGTIPQPDFVKCDVEGAEALIFRGAATAFDREEAPIVLYEADSRSAAAFNVDVAEATRVLRGYSRAAFSFYWVRPNAVLQPIDLPGGRCQHFNLLAVPASRQSRISQAVE